MIKKVGEMKTPKKTIVKISGEIKTPEETVTKNPKVDEMNKWNQL